jgi:hypothetical protein
MTVHLVTALAYAHCGTHMYVLSIEREILLNERNELSKTKHVSTEWSTGDPPFWKVCG